MSDRLDNILFHEHTCPSLDQMMQYKDAVLGEQESHAVERHLLSCSMCSEVIEHLQHDNVGEMSALTAAIDLKVDERISQGGAGGSELNFNLLMSIAAALTGALILAGNLFMNLPTGPEGGEMPIEPEEAPIAVEILPNEPRDLSAGEHESVQPTETALEEAVEISIPDSAIKVNEETRLEVDELSSIDPNETIVVASSADKEGAEDQGIAPDLSRDLAASTETFLTASVEMLSVERIGEPTGSKGSTKKKVKIKSISGYAPEYQDEEGFPFYKGGDEKLKEDIINNINELHIALGEGGSVEIEFSVAASGALGNIVVDEKVSILLANEIKGAIASLSVWVPGNVEIRYNIKVALQ